MYYFDDDTLYIDHLHLCCIRILDAQNIKGKSAFYLKEVGQLKSAVIDNPNLSHSP